MTSRHVVVLLLTSLLSSHARSDDIPSGEVTAEIVALDNAWIQAEVERDRAALEKILDEQFLVTYSSGKTIDRAAFISRIMQSDIKPFEVIHEEIRVHGNTVLVIDSSTDKKTRFVWIAVKKGDQWKVISEVFVTVKAPN